MNILFRLTSHTTRRAAALITAAALLGSLFACDRARAYTAESPEVQKLVAQGLAALEKPVGADVDRYSTWLGGKCLVGLAFVKAKKPTHPLVEKAVTACRDGMKDSKTIDVYSNGVAIVFLCELSPKKYQREIQWYLDLLQKRQKPHGGWGYDGSNPEQANFDTGDTSQTQYATLGYWEAYRHGFRIDPNSLGKVAEWLLRTQDPSGCWGYQGIVSQGSQLTTQSATGCSMLAAGLSGTLICADLLDAGPAAADSDLPLDLLNEAGQAPPALRRANEIQDGTRPAPMKLHTQRIDVAEILAAIDRARAWMDKNYELDVGKYQYYYLYATERYQSFYELLEGSSEEEAKWYNDGYDYLAKHQQEWGGWEGACGRTADTSFAILFLLRSTQKSIKATLGEGTLVAGRGIPANVSRAKMRGNRIIVEQVQTKVDEMLSMIDDGDQSKLDELARDPTSLIVDHVDEKSARRLQQLVRGGEPEVRLLAVRALGRAGKLDYVPTLIYALTDPEPRVVLEARDGLQFVSRRFEGYGPPDNFTEKERYDASDAWKKWFRKLRPGSLPGD